MSNVKNPEFEAKIRRSRDGKFTDKTKPTPVAATNIENPYENDPTDTAYEALHDADQHVTELVEHKGRLSKAATEGMSPEAKTAVDALRKAHRTRFGLTPDEESAAYQPLAEKTELTDTEFAILAQAGSYSHHAYERTDMTPARVRYAFEDREVYPSTFTDAHMSEDCWNEFDKHLTEDKNSWDTRRDLISNNPSYPHAEQVAKDWCEHVKSKNKWLDEYDEPVYGEAKPFYPEIGGNLLKRTDLSDDMRHEVERMNKVWEGYANHQNFINRHLDGWYRLNSNPAEVHTA